MKKMTDRTDNKDKNGQSDREKAEKFADLLFSMLSGCRDILSCDSQEAFEKLIQDDKNSGDKKSDRPEGDKTKRSEN